MNLKKLIKREIMITIGTILLITTTFFGVTYAVYMSIDEENVGTISFGDISFEMCANINCSQISNLGTIISGELYPMNETEGLSQTPYTFIATNNGNRAVHVTTYAAIHTDNIGNYDNVQIATKQSTDSNYTFTRMTDEVIITKEKIEIAPGQSKTINVLVWGNEELSNEMIGKTFRLFINAIAYYYPEDPNEEYGTYVANVNADLVRGIAISYSNSYQEWEAPMSGYYQIEAWGAQGGSLDLYNNTKNGGLGSYTSGKIFLSEGEKIYIYTGGQGRDIASPGSAVIPGGYNGGGSGIAGSNRNQAATSGGGATDIRYFGNVTPTAEQLEWDNDLGLNSRIMVAAGGSGAYNYDGNALGGRPGGELTSKQDDYDYATQISGNSFGKGMDGFYASSSEDFGITGGGGGYYGGTRAKLNASPSTPNNPVIVSMGGSSYISGYAGVNSVTENSNSNPRNHINQTNHYSGKHFLDGKMTSGVNESNGKVKITYIGLSPRRVNEALNNVRYIKDCISGNSTDLINRWQEIQAVVDGVNLAKGKTAVKIGGTYLYSTEYITDGDIGAETYTDGYSDATCIYIDLGANINRENGLWNLDELAVWHSWSTSYQNTISPITSVSADNINWTTIMESTTNLETPQGKRVNAYQNNL